ncbi:MAG: hypothetical protein BWY26_00971 [Elusimicrobia bacterium ADurb.Bin231]|nr:MAG: hypothetical protein BWY26_00971 [Elusimicrobia bacterium ADurb.Bin231]
MKLISFRNFKRVEIVWLRITQKNIFDSDDSKCKKHIDLSKMPKYLRGIYKSLIRKNKIHTLQEFLKYLEKKEMRIIKYI